MALFATNARTVTSNLHSDPAPALGAGLERPRVEDIDASTLARARDGDAEAFRRLVEHYQRLVASVAFTMTGDRHDAEDVAQEAFLRVYRGLESFRGEAAFTTWVFRVAVSAALDHRRRRRRSFAASPDGEAGELTVDVGRREATPEQRERALAVVAAMGTLRPALRGPLVLREVYGLEYNEIAVLLDRPVGTVKAAVHRGRRALLAELRERGEYDGPVPAREESDEHD